MRPASRLSRTETVILPVFQLIRKGIAAARVSARCPNLTHKRSVLQVPQIRVEGADRGAGAHFEIRIPDQPVSISQLKQRKGAAGSA